MAIMITGASAGFGAAMCRCFVQASYPVIGVARRGEKLAALKEELGELFHAVEADITDKPSVDLFLENLNQLEEPFRTIDCLINNAGLALGLEPAHAVNFDDWETMIQTNIIGLTYLTHKILPQMVERKNGYIINLGSIAGTYPYPGGNVYGASKAFVRQFSLNLRADLHGTGVRVSNIEPGLCSGTEFSNVRFKGDDTRAAALYEHTESLLPEDIAQTALWLYQRPKHVNVNSLEIMPISQSFGALPVDRRPPPSVPALVDGAETTTQTTKDQSVLGKIASWFK